MQERTEFDEPDYALIDTLFSLAEAHLFMQLVELMDSRPGIMPPNKACSDIYRCTLTSSWVFFAAGHSWEGLHTL